MSKTIKNVARRVTTADKVARKAAVKSEDSFQNFAAHLGLGTSNLMSGGTYGFNPVSRLRTLLEWIHRGSWLGGLIVDLVASDMTRAGVELTGDIDPDDIERIEERATELAVWERVEEAIKWARLYGGSIAVMMIDGQDPKTPLRPETIGRDQFKGVLPLDRWMVEPSLNDLVEKQGRDIGLPKFYTVCTDAPALSRMKIHHTRCIRLEGIRLPYWQRIQELLWGISVLERIYDRMIAFDSATTGAAQLVYKSYLRVVKVDKFRAITSAGGQAAQGFQKYFDMMRLYQSMEGITLLDKTDDYEEGGAQSFTGISEVLIQLGQQISGSAQIPLVRLFGQSPVGLNATGESDLRTYYDGIRKEQNTHLKVGMTVIYRALAQSEGIRLPDGFGLAFSPLWQLKDEERADVAQKVVASVSQARQDGIIGTATALKELKQSSKMTGIFTNISTEDIDKAEEQDQLAPQVPLPGSAGATEGTLVVSNPQSGENASGNRQPGQSVPAGAGGQVGQ